MARTKLHRVSPKKLSGKGYISAEDHKRDGFFLDHGVWVHRFDANECFKHPDDVVRRFLQRLKRVHRS